MRRRTLGFPRCAYARAYARVYARAYARAYARVYACACALCTHALLPFAGCSHARTNYTPKREQIADRWLQNVYASRGIALWDNKDQSLVQWPQRVVP